MRPLLVLSLLVAGGCTEPTATVSLGWSLEGGSCQDLGVYKGGAGLVDLDGNALGGGCLPCEQSLQSLVIEDVPYGTYRVNASAYDQQLVVLGSGERMVEVGETEDGWVHAGATVRVEKRGVTLRFRWKLTKQGAPTTCADLGNPRIYVMVSSGYFYKYACDATDVTLDIEKGPVTVYADLVDANEKVLGKAQPVEVPIMRGQQDIDFALDAE